MGSFANTLFSVLLGWVQSAAAWLWQMAGHADAGSFMSWVLDNWLSIVIVICGAGVLIDLLVYLVRWQPYRVWRSFWQRLLNGEEEEEILPEAPVQPTIQRQWLYADGTTAMEEPEPVQPAMAADNEFVQQLDPNKYQGRAWAHEMDEMQLDSPVKPVRRVIPARRRRRRAADGSQEYLLPELGSEQQAYHQPYYPVQWNTGEQQMIDKGDDT